MKWLKSFFSNPVVKSVLLAAAAGAASAAIPHLPQPGEKADWSKVGNQALAGAIHGGLKGLGQTALQP